MPSLQQRHLTFWTAFPRRCSQFSLEPIRKGHHPSRNPWPCAWTLSAPSQPCQPSSSRMNREKEEAFAYAQHEGESNPLQPVPAPPAPYPGRVITIEDAFAAAHNARSGHLGWRRTLLAMRARFPNLAIPHLKVKDLVDNCPTCSKYRNQATTVSREVLHSLPKPTAASYVSVDCFKPLEDHNGNAHVLVLINHSTDGGSAGYAFKRVQGRCTGIVRTLLQGRRSRHGAYRPRCRDTQHRC